MLTKISLILLAAAVATFTWRRVLSYLRYLQQDDYNVARFSNWLKENRAYDRRGSTTVLVASAITLMWGGAFANFLLSVLTAATLIWLALYYEEDPRISGKVKLKMTARARRIASVAYAPLALMIAIPIFIKLTCGACCHSTPSPLSTLLLGALTFQLTPLALILANRVLAPFERRIQAKYYNDAKRILREVDPLVIGITGSYGKTGAKTALGELLIQTLGDTFWPKKSINTVMGITRTIRETMRPSHRYAVIEMGAYNIGSIRRLCDFTPPRAALVTAVGIMHLERFGSPENVYKAKSEIAQALPSDGILVCNGDSPNARRMALEHHKGTTLLYGFDLTKGPLDCFATDISFDNQGTKFTIHYKGTSFPGRTPLLGRPALLNALGAFTMVCALGADPAYAAACLSNLTPVDNRLALDRGDPVSYLRDAFNSNPIGFEAALEVLRDLPATRRVLITPGMIELGELQHEENRKIAKIAASVCDLIYVISETNREAILAGLADANFPKERIIVAATRDEGFKILAERSVRGDLVLIENDLTDLHEGEVRF